MYLKQDAGKVNNSTILTGIDKQTKQKTISLPPKPALYTRPGNGNLERENIFKQILYYSQNQKTLQKNKKLKSTVDLPLNGPAKFQWETLPK